MDPKARDRRTMHTIRRRLEQAYGPRHWDDPSDAVDSLVGTILSQNTTGTNARLGLRRLKQRFANWEEAADAPVQSIQACIRPCGLSRIKAPRIRSILRHVRGDRNRVDLAFLSDLPVDTAYEYLLGLTGVGPKTALCVLLFALGRAVFPVDTHIDRIARRLGLLPETVPTARAHEHLTPRIAPDDRYALHVLLVHHGRVTCRARRPRCGDCRLLSLCPHGQALLHGT